LFDAMRFVQALLVAIVLVPAPVLTSCGTSKMCAVCAREECGNLSFRIQFASGEAVETCCPRCGIQYLKTEQRAVAALEVRDFESARAVDARSAWYVVGSDVMPCKDMHASKPTRDEQGCCIRTTYDRCVPSVLAFAGREQAAAFAGRHGGDLSTFDEL
jgi:hypothetical protein